MEIAKLLNEVDIIEIISQYDIGTYVSMREFTTGTVQQNIQVETTQGKYFLKYYKSRTPEYAAVESELVVHLNSKEFTCPKLYKTKSGNLYMLKDDRAIIIYEYVEGEHKKQLTQSEHDQLTSLIAKLHLLTIDLNLKGIDHRWNYDIDFCKKYLENKSEAYQKSNQSEKLQWALEELNKLQLPEHVTKGIVHGDLDYSNFYFSNGQLKSLIDFDDANYSYLVFDIICLVDNQCESFLDTKYFATIRQVVKVYNETRPLNQAERMHLFDVLKLSIIIDSFWFFERGEFPDFKEKQKLDRLDEIGRERFSSRIFEP